MYKVYAIGPLPIEGDVIGGTKVSFENLVYALEQEEQIELTTLNSSRALRNRVKFLRQVLNLVTLIKVLLLSAVASFKNDVIIWNVSPTALPFAGLLFWLATGLGRAKIIVRVFGGDLDKVVKQQQHWVRKMMLSVLFRFDAVLLQTRYLVKRFEGNKSSIHWFPTTRSFKAEQATASVECRRFLYLGQLRREKGIPEIIAAAHKLKEGSSITVCGPLVNSYDPVTDIVAAGIEYLEPVSSVDVGELLCAFDALLFPSYYPGEGYPGVIIEALQSGLPVITTHWKSLPEIIVHGENGMLIEPNNSGALVRAMEQMQMDPTYYRSLCKGAVASGKQFNTYSAVNRLKTIIDQLISGSRR